MSKKSVNRRAFVFQSSGLAWNALAPGPVLERYAKAVAYLSVSVTVEGIGMKSTIASIVAMGVIVFSAGADDGWVDLFDGKTLEGWVVKAKPADRATSFWKVKDGSITCDSLGKKDHGFVWLVTEREFADFELELMVRGSENSPGNSGVQLRSRYDDVAFKMDGPQVDVHPPTPWRTGLIYDETRGAERWIFPSLPDWKIEASYAPKGWKWHQDEWNTLRILCRGKRIQTWLNGVPAADLDGKGLLDDEVHRLRNVGLSGHVALQLHGQDELYIQYKEIRIKPLR